MKPHSLQDRLRGLRTLRWAKGPLLASLIGRIGQDAALFGMSAVEISAWVYALKGMVPVIAVLLLLLANRAAREGWVR